VTTTAETTPPAVRILREEYENAVWARRIALLVFQLPAGFLVTEERDGASRVVATLGAFDTREAALDTVRARGAELTRQRYRPVSTA
jgi:hypothetical protein